MSRLLAFFSLGSSRRSLADGEVSAAGEDWPREVAGLFCRLIFVYFPPECYDEEVRATRP